MLDRDSAGGAKKFATPRATPSVSLPVGPEFGRLKSEIARPGFIFLAVLTLVCEIYAGFIRLAPSAITADWVTIFLTVLTVACD